MHTPQIDVRQLRATSENDMFIDLVAQKFPDDTEAVGSFQIKHILPAGDGTVYAVYEENRNVLAVQFYLRDKLLTFCDEEPVHYMSIDEIKLLREIGEVSIDGISYFVDNMVFNLIDGAVGCQHMIIINLKTTY